MLGAGVTRSLLEENARARVLQEQIMGRLGFAQHAAFAGQAGQAGWMQPSPPRQPRRHQPRRWPESQDWRVDDGLRPLPEIRMAHMAPKTARPSTGTPARRKHQRGNRSPPNSWSPPNNMRRTPGAELPSKQGARSAWGSPLKTPGVERADLLSPTTPSSEGRVSQKHRAVAIVHGLRNLAAEAIQTQWRRRMAAKEQKGRVSESRAARARATPAHPAKAATEGKPGLIGKDAENGNEVSASLDLPCNLPQQGCS